jgi:hypothetical protein
LIHRADTSKKIFIVNIDTRILNKIPISQLVREASWSAIDGAMSMETITVAKTSLLTDVQAAVEKDLGLGEITV